MIAYLIPGFVLLWGFGLISEEVRSWLHGSSIAGPTIGGFLYVTIASVGLGMTASALRWILVDSLHHATGVDRPSWSDHRLHERLPGYDWIVNNHYRYYQFYGNTLISILLVYLIWRVSSINAVDEQAIGLAVAFVVSVFLASSRDALKRYYARTESLLGVEEGIRTMTNGGHHIDNDEKNKAKAKPAKATSKEPSKKAKTEGSGSKPQK
ncbi:MAG: hypothetical protein H6813_06655 [Phycisphaeraceae bacterium]|nr:hypothetical protein [Phycisphaeraceae bacterium]MCB9848151.1 hypothetical protein [Phycisphaeraceae bacterium]